MTYHLHFEFSLYLNFRAARSRKISPCRLIAFPRFTTIYWLSNLFGCTTFMGCTNLLVILLSQVVLIYAIRRILSARQRALSWQTTFRLQRSEKDLQNRNFEGNNVLSKALSYAHFSFSIFSISEKCCKKCQCLQRAHLVKVVTSKRKQIGIIKVDVF